MGGSVRPAPPSATPIDFPQCLRDDTVVVRQLAEDDPPAYARAFRDDPDLGRLLGIPRDLDEDWVRTAVPRARESARRGTWIELVVCDAEERALLGAIGLTAFSAQHRRCELGYWLVPGARGQGVARRACTLVVRWLFASHGLLRIEVVTTAENVASQHVAVALGFTREALQRQRDVERGRRVDVIRYGLLREEWPNRAV